MLLPTAACAGSVETSAARRRVLAAPSRDFATVDAVETAANTRITASAMRTVAIMAFCQSLLFLVLWLLICARAGAATPAKTEFRPDLVASAYNSVKPRDPFGKVGAGKDFKALPGAAVAFRLEGILFSAVSPSAIVNGTLVTLNKTVTLSAGNGEIQVKAVEITRERVVIEAGGQRVELQLNSRDPKEQTRP